jgi:hypothetical protein
MPNHLYEHRTQPMLSRAAFARRMLQHGGLAFVVVTASMVIGTAGFHYLAGQSSIDAFLNAAMLLGGMGPVGDIQSDAGKIFASFFALFAGLVFIAILAILTAPLLHRMIHRFHLDKK